MITMDLTEFRDSGLLQEVNRLFFHPRGLALSVWCEDPDENGKVIVSRIADILSRRREHPSGTLTQQKVSADGQS